MECYFLLCSVLSSHIKLHRPYQLYVLFDTFTILSDTKQRLPWMTWNDNGNEWSFPTDAAVAFKTFCNKNLVILHCVDAQRLIVVLNGFLSKIYHCHIHLQGFVCKLLLHFSSNKTPAVELMPDNFWNCHNQNYLDNLSYQA